MTLKEAQIWCKDNMPNSKIIDLKYKTIGKNSDKKYCFVLVKCLLNENHKINWKRFASFKRQKFGCKECADELNTTSNKKIKYEEVKYYIDNNTNFELLTFKNEYKNSKQKLCLKCNCENKTIEYISFEKIKYYNKIECYDCTIKHSYKKWNSETIKNYLDTINYKFIDMDRNDSKLRVKVKCPNEKHPEYWVDWSSIYNNKSLCRLCYYENENKIIWNNEKITEFFRINSLKVLNIEIWKNTDSRLKCLGDDGFYYNTSIHNITKNKKYGHSHSIFKHNPYALLNLNIILKLIRPDYKCISKFYKGYNGIKYKFKYIGSLLDKDASPYFKTTINSMLKKDGVDHPFISMSKGEKRTYLFLEKNKIKFDNEYTNHNCRNPKTQRILKFDFVLLNDDDSIKKIIEIDGQFHYENIITSYKDFDFENVQYRDNIKNKWAKDNNIPIIRIPYFEFDNLEKILTKEAII